MASRSRPPIDKLWHFLFAAQQKHPRCQLTREKAHYATSKRHTIEKFLSHHWIVVSSALLDVSEKNHQLE
jgi:hypothetical protein